MTKQNTYRLRTVLCTLGVVLGLFALCIINFGQSFTPKATAAASTYLNFQARLKTSSGSVVPDGYYNLEFKVYDHATAGNLLWTETRTGSDRVRVANGYFTVSLGSVTAFPGTINWSEEKWITMNIGGTDSTADWDGEMTNAGTRMMLTAVPYAFHADKANSLTDGTNTYTADDFIKIGPGSSQSTSSSDAAVRINQTGAGGLLQLQSGGNDLLTLNNSGDLDLGSGSLTVAGNSTIEGGTLTVGTASQKGTVVLSDGSSNTITLQASAVGGNYTVSIPTITANDTFCLQTLANCGSPSLWTDAGIYTYLADTNENLVVGSNATTDARLYVVGADAAPVDLEWDDQSGTNGGGWQSVAYSPDLGRFVAVGWDGTNRVMYSDDGETWTSSGVTGVQSNQWESVAYGNGMFVATSFDGTNKVMSSPDGITWTARTPALNVSWRAVAYGNGTFVAVGSSNVMYSSDGITWSNLGVFGANSNLVTIAFANGVFVAGSNGGTSRIMTSTDGKNWTQRTAAQASSWYHLAYGDGRWVAVSGDGTTRAMYSDDNGATWSNSGVTGVPQNTWRSVAYGGGQFVAVAEDGTNRVMTSLDGATWTAEAVTSNRWWDVEFAADKEMFVAVSYNGTNRVMTASTSGYSVPTAFRVAGSSELLGALSVTGSLDLSGQLNVTNDALIKAATNSTNTFVVQDASSNSVFSVDTSNSRVVIGSSDTTGTLLVLDTKTDSGDPTGVNGGMYYNADAGKFRCYEDGEWKDCITTAGSVTPQSVTYVVAASDSPAHIKATADYVADGTSDEDEINAALTAGAGGKIYLAEGTYVADGTITIPNNTVLEGAGLGTIIELADIDASDELIEATGSDKTGQTIKNLVLDGRKDLNTAGTQRGITLYNVGDEATNRPGAHIENVIIRNFRNQAILLFYSSNNTISNSTVSDSATGIDLSASHRNVITGTRINGNGMFGISSDSSNSNIINGNSIYDNQYGIYISGSTEFSVVSNVVSSNEAYGVYLSSVEGSIISSNRLHDNGGSDAYDGIYVTASDNNQITNNQITDTEGSGYAINISDSSSDGTYLAGNTYSGTGAASINDAGTGTIYGGQVNGSNGFEIQPAGGVSIGTNGVARAVTIGSQTGASVLNLRAGTGTAGGDINLYGQAGSIINIGANAVNNKVINIGSTGNIANGSQINIATTGGNATQEVNIGSVSSANNVVLISGGTSSNAIRLQTGAGGAISLANNTAVATVNIGTGGTGAKTVNIGSTASTGTTTIRSGSGGILLQPSGSNVTIGTVNNTGTLLVLDTKSNSGDPTGVIGGMYYNDSDAKFRCYENYTWKDCISAGDIVNGGQYDAVTIGTKDSNSLTLKTNDQSALTIASGGAVTLQNATDSTAAFQIQNSAGAALMTADTTNMQVTIGGGSGSGRLHLSGGIVKPSVWTGHAAPTQWWESVAYGNGLFVAVSSDGSNRVMTSPDGENWTSQSPPEVKNWYSVTYGNGLFVAVGDAIMTSPDGVNWTSQSLPAGNVWYSVTYGNGLFVAVAYGQVMTSPDGENWTLQTAAENNGWLAVTYGNGLFVAISTNGTHQVMTSPDGENWTAQTAASGSGWSSVTYGNGLFVATGWQTVMTSPDGENWTSQTIDTKTWYEVTYGNGTFVAVGWQAVASSPDGVNWTSHTPSEPNQWQSVTYGNGLFVAVSVDATEPVMTSSTYEMAALSTDGGISINGASALQGDVDITGLLNVAGDSILNSVSVLGHLTIGVSDTTGTLLVLDTKTDSGDPDGVNGAMYYNADAGKFRCYEGGAWKDCITPGNTAGTRVARMIPEFEGMVMRGDGSNNVGYLTADFCSGSSRMNINATACGSTDTYNYYNWTTNEASAQDYDLYVRWRVPDDYTAGSVPSAVTVHGWRTDSTNNAINVGIFNANGVQCGSTTQVAGNGSWAATAVSSVSGSNCEFSPGEYITFRISIVADTNDSVRLGHIEIGYISSF